MRKLTLLLVLVVSTAAMTPALSSTVSASSNRYPNPWTLLAKALKQQGKEYSAHGSGQSSLTTKVKTKKGVEPVSDVGHFSGDALMAASGRSRVTEQDVETEGTRQIVVSYEYAAKGKKLAIAPTSTHKWLCKPVSFLNKILEWTPTSFGVLSLTPKPKTAAVVGVATVSGHLTWDVKTVISNKSAKTTQTDHYLIDQKKFIVRDMYDVTTGVDKGQKWQQTASVILTKFGESVPAKLPAKC